MSEVELITQVFINGILFGTMYGTAAIGLSLIFGTMRIVFIAQGTVIVLFGYFCFWLFSLLGVDPYLSLIPIIIVALLIGLGFYYGLFKEAAALKDRIGSLLIAVGLMFFLANFMTLSRITESIPVRCMMPPKLNAVKATSWVSIILIIPPREIS